MMLKKSVSVLLNTHMIMGKIVRNVICPPTGISLPLSVKSVLSKATTILSPKNVSLVLTIILSGTAPSAPNAQYNHQSGMESTVITAHQDNIGTSNLRNVLHAQLVKSTTMSKIFVFVLLKRPSCSPAELA